MPQRAVAALLLAVLALAAHAAPRAATRNSAALAHKQPRSAAGRGGAAGGDNNTTAAPRPGLHARSAHARDADNIHHAYKGNASAGDDTINGLQTRGRDSASTSTRSSCTAYTDDSCPSGDRVKRGPGWMWGERDGGHDHGTVTGVASSARWCRVTWDNGDSDTYRVGEDGAHDLCLVSASGGDRRSDSCIFSNDGQCDDGQYDDSESTLCPRGTDDSDCTDDATSGDGDTSSGGGEGGDGDEGGGFSELVGALVPVVLLGLVGYACCQWRRRRALVPPSEGRREENHATIELSLGHASVPYFHTGHDNMQRKLYHATSIENALRIQEQGFKVSPHGCLGRGVYCTSTITKATDYLKGKPHGGVILELWVDLGRCKQLRQNDPMMTTWQAQYDSAYAPFSAVNPWDLEKTENCVKDPKRIKVLQAFEGDTSALRKAGYAIIHGKVCKV